MGPTARRALGGLLSTAVIVMALASCDSDGAAERTGTATACSPERDLDEGTSTVDLTADGEKRTFLLHVPEGYDGTKRTPVVFMFHGLGSNSRAMVETSQMDAEADRRGFILVAPQGRGEISKWDYNTPATTKGSDLAFVDSLVDDVRKRACVDDARVFASGFSNGSLLTLAIACSDDKNFAAFGAVSGPIDAATCAAAPARPIIYFHGTVDPVVPFRGAKTILGTFPPVPRAMRSWASHDECAETPTTTVVSKNVQSYDWSGCADGSDLQAYVVYGGGHRWPGGMDTTSGQDAGAQTQSIDATRLISKFFAEHSAGGQ